MDLPKVQEGGLAGTGSFCKHHLLSRARTQDPQAETRLLGKDIMPQRKQSRKTQSTGQGV